MKKRVKGLLLSLSMAAVAAVAVCASGCGASTPNWWNELTCGAHEFDEGVVKKEATCTEEGEVIYTCAECGLIETKTLEKIPHEEIYVARKEATCTEDGNLEGIICENCGVKLEGATRIPATGHTEEVTKEGKEATCTETGLTEEVTCSVCNEVLQEQVEIPALGHSFEGNTCTVCDWEDLSDYTEVAAEVGEAIAGNWYRIYRPEVDNLTFNDFNGIVLSIEGVGEICLMHIKSEDLLNKNAIAYYDSYSAFFQESQIKGLKIQRGDGYFDFFVEDDIIISSGSLQLTVPKDSTIKAIRKFGTGEKTGAFRLVPPASDETTGKEDEELDAVEPEKVNLEETEQANFPVVVVSIVSDEEWTVNY